MGKGAPPFRTVRGAPHNNRHGLSTKWRWIWTATAAVAAVAFVWAALTTNDDDAPPLEWVPLERCVSPLDGTARFVCGASLRRRSASDGGRGGYECRAKEMGPGGPWSKSSRGAPSIPMDWVDDDYCDCHDGSDEKHTGACAIRGGPTGRARFCHAEDFQDECCFSGGDEPEATNPRCRALNRGWLAVVETQLRMVEVAMKSLETDSETQESIIRRAVKETESALHEMDAEAMGVISELDSINATREALKVEWMTTPTTSAKRTVISRKIFEASVALQERMERLDDMTQHQQRLVGFHEVLRQAFELKGSGTPQLTHLIGHCVEGTVSERLMRGGSADPVSGWVRFRICPIHNATQQTLRDQPTEGEEISEEALSDIGSKPTIVSIIAANVTMANPLRLPIISQGVSQAINVGRMLSSIAKRQVVHLLGSKVALLRDGSLCPAAGGYPPVRRQTTVVLQCAEELRWLAGYENGRCRYEIIVGTPAACTSLLRETLIRLRDGLSERIKKT